MAKKMLIKLTTFKKTLYLQTQTQTLTPTRHKKNKQMKLSERKRIGGKKSGNSAKRRNKC